MIKRLSVSLCNSWANSGVISVEHREIYQYGLELLFSTAVNFILLVLISLFLGHPFSVAAYLVSFVPLRLLAGGYHAKHHWSCILITAVTFFLMASMALNIQEEDSSAVCMATSIASFCILLRYSPIQSGNKPLTVSEKKRNGIISKIIGGILIILSCIFKYKNLADLFEVKMIYAGEAAAVILLFFGRIDSKNILTDMQ